MTCIIKHIILAHTTGETEHSCFSPPPSRLRLPLQYIEWSTVTLTVTTSLQCVKHTPYRFVWYSTNDAFYSGADIILRQLCENAS